MGYRRASDWAPLFSTLAQVYDAGGDDPDCYTRFEETFWNTTMWFGGPGRTGTGACDPF